MAFKEVRVFRLSWDSKSKQGGISLWLVGSSGGPNNPDHAITKLDPAEFGAICSLLKNDSNQKVYYDSSASKFDSGPDSP
jgi:hypothetical protein